MNVYNRLKDFFLEHRFPSKLTSEKLLEAKPVESQLNFIMAYGNLNQILKIILIKNKLKINKKI